MTGGDLLVWLAPFGGGAAILGDWGGCPRPVRRAELIGCARVVTGLTRFAYLSDVYLNPLYRGGGPGRWLVQTTLDHPAMSDNARWVLHTHDAHGLYAQLGFEPAGENVMEHPRKSTSGS